MRTAVARAYRAYIELLVRSVCVVVVLVVVSAAQPTKKIAVNPSMMNGMSLVSLVVMPANSRIRGNLVVTDF
ncbi:MAG: hypothetical protein ACJ8KX_00520 [Chthoniobacterales bacterium]